MEDQYVRNYLFIGASSKIVDYIIRNNDYKSCKYYGVSSKKDLLWGRVDITVFGYEDIDKYKDVSFSTIFVLASRLPWEAVDLNAYLSVNNRVEDLLNSLSYENTKRSRIVLLSTFSVYDAGQSEINDLSCVVKKNNYVISKLDMERIVLNYSETVGIESLLLRIPVFAYPGESTNFISRLIAATKSNGDFCLTNRHSKLSAIFDVDNLLAIEKNDWAEHQIVNCGAYPDITFDEIGEIALSLGLEKIEWKVSDFPSQIVDTSALAEILGIVPSAREIVMKAFGWGL